MMRDVTLPRVMWGASGRPLTLREHEMTFGAAKAGAALAGELEASGLMGRGGANFTTRRRWSSCARSAAITRSWS